MMPFETTSITTSTEEIAVSVIQIDQLRIQMIVNAKQNVQSQIAVLTRGPVILNQPSHGS